AALPAGRVAPPRRRLPDRVALTQQLRAARVGAGRLPGHYGFPIWPPWPPSAPDLPVRPPASWTRFQPECRFDSERMLPKPDPAAPFQPVPEGAILLHMAQEVYFGLNPDGGEVWQLLPPTCQDLDQPPALLRRRPPDRPARQPRR